MVTAGTEMPSGVFHITQKASASAVSAHPNRAEAFSREHRKPGARMNTDDEKILRLTKEVIIKFIELGRVSPSNFDQQFKNVFWTIKNTIVNAQAPDFRAEMLSATESDVEKD
jgi:hypothetical protein